ncbi:hypothetical protein N7493_003817 [Penicillium malachiteum]|uniref:Enoyl reductase (ER) domain-containing protein n=1 Tax=Penicillium malachiteum TaxID=1324776 RepID=A0AAD6MY12_9EURO|nr:hypothetical protein N7493_003817 [Penicillium malachiteum]
MTHQAAFIKERHANLVVEHVETPSPGDDEILVKVEVIAFSPIEYKLQRYIVSRPQISPDTKIQPRFELHKISYPHALGLTFSGIVHAVGPNVISLKVGDNIAGARGIAQLNDNRFGAYQQFALVKEKLCSKLLPRTTLEDAAAAILNLATISSALTLHLGLDRPSLSGTPSTKGEKVLIYGGSSMCGGLAIKFAVAAGYTVVTTSSPRNLDFVESLGADHIIDHTAAPKTIQDELVHHGPYKAILDTIGSPPTSGVIMPYLASIGGGVYNALTPLIGDAPGNVQCRFASYGWDIENEEHPNFRRWFFEELLPKGLESGLVTPIRTQEIEGGLGNAQKALDMMANGAVSGRKLIMYP